MHRPILAALAALAASACTYGSAVDIAPFDARVSHAVLPPGDYCEMQMRTVPEVISSEGCLRIDWDGVRRIHTMTDLSRPGTDEAGQPVEVEKQELAIVALGDSLYAAQFTSPDHPGRYELVTFLARGEAVVGIAMVEDATLRRLVATRPQMMRENLPLEKAARKEPGLLVTSSP